MDNSITGNKPSRIQGKTKQIPPRLLDCRGLACPQPVITAKEALESMPGGTVGVLVDNEAARNNLERFGKSQGYTVDACRDGEVLLVRLCKPGGKGKKAGAGPAPGPGPGKYHCDASPSQAGGAIMLITADGMGRGDEELGRVLMRAFIKTIKQLSPLPGKIFFYNSGVKLTASENDLIAPLAELAGLGVEIYSCGACLDFFHLKDSLKIGQVTNMYEIMAAMAGAGKIMSPC